MTSQLIAEGFAGAVGGHTLEGLADRTLRGLLEDQEAAYDMMFDDVASGRPLSACMMRSWHALLTRHQDTVAGIDVEGRRVQVGFTRKGQWKDRSNNPRRPDGVLYEYCPPEQVEPEMRRFLAMYNNEIQGGRYPVNVEAAWLHHRFARTHPFQDGNGRVSRLLMAWAYVKRGLPPPVVSAEGKLEYILALEAADAGQLRRFSDYVGGRAADTLRGAVLIAERGRGGAVESTERQWWANRGRPLLAARHGAAGGRRGRRSFRLLAAPRLRRRRQGTRRSERPAPRGRFGGAP